MNYEFGRKTDSTQAVQDKLNALAEKENQRQKVIRIHLSGILHYVFSSIIIFLSEKKNSP